MLKKKIKKVTALCSVTIHSAATLVGIYALRKTIFYIDMASDLVEITSNTKNNIKYWYDKIDEESD